MKLLEFKWDSIRQCFYTDRHEHAENKLYRFKFISAYLEYELRCYRWVHVSEEAALRLELPPPDEDDDTRTEVLPGNQELYHSYEVLDANGRARKMREYHVDVFIGSLLEVFVDPECRRFGGNLSVRKPDNIRPLLIFGQDEAVFYQYAASSKGWRGSKGQHVLRQKGTGEAIMISAFVSDATGGHPDITPEVIERANSMRQGSNYQSNDAIMTVRDNSDTSKHLFTMEQFEAAIMDSPLLKMFRHGANHEGYWNGNKMKMQFEDAVDLVKALFPGHDFLFLFDQSSGHTKKKEDGLDVSVMNESHVQKTPIELRPSKLTEDCIGPFQKDEDGIASDKLVAGDIQVFTWPISVDGMDDDSGPFYIAAEGRRRQRFDVAVEPYQKEDLVPKNSYELKRDLADQCIDFTSILGGDGLAGLKKLAEDNDIPTMTTETHKKTKEKTSSELVADLQSARVQMERRKYKKKELTKMAIDKGIAITYEEHKLKHVGWLGKPKGMRQILWETGWLDP